MAKKKATTKTTATGKSAKAASSKTKAAKKPAASKGGKTDEIKLDAVEQQAFQLAHSSKAVCQELELSVSEAICQAVRKVFKQHKIALTQEQGETVAFVLFGD